MQEVQRGIVEDFGMGYVKFGHSELLGRVVGLLLCQTEPVSIEEICDELDVTKTPITQICRRLEELKLVRRVRVKGERRHYFQIVPDIFLQASINISRLYEDNLQVAENHLQPLLEQFERAEGDEKETLRTVCERLIMMREYNLRLIQSHQRFINEWKAAKAELPSVEEYAILQGSGMRAQTIHE